MKLSTKEGAMYTLQKIDNLEKENQELKKQLDCALKILAEMFPPCERDGFMDKHSDYCQWNCSVAEEIFKKCWLMYIKDKLKEVESNGIKKRYVCKN